MEMTNPQVVKRSLKIVIVSVVIVAVMIGLAIMAVEPVLNSSAVKSKVEKTVGEALGMSFNIEGKIEIGYWPLLSVAADKLSVSTSKGQIAFADRIEIDPRLPDLFSLKVHLEDVHIQNPKLTFDSHALGKIVAIAGLRTDDPLPIESLVIDTFTIANAKFYYSDDQFVVDVNQMNFDGGRIAIIENREVAIGGVKSFFRAANFRGGISARQVGSKDFKLTNVKAQIKDENGILTFNPVELEYLGSGAKFVASLGLLEQKPILESQVSLTGLNIGALAQKFSPDYKIRGKSNLIANISAGPNDIDQILAETSGKDHRGTLGANRVYPVRSFHIKKFSLTATEVGYSKGKTSVQIPRLNFAGDQLAVIKDSRLRINDFKSLIAVTKYKVDAAINRINMAGNDIRDVLMNFKIDNGDLITDAIHINYLGSKTKISGKFDLLHKLPDAQMRIESSASDIRLLAARILPDVDIGGGKKFGTLLTNLTKNKESKVIAWI